MKELEPYLPYIIGGIVLLIIIVIIIILVSKKKKIPARQLEKGPIQDLNKYENSVHPNPANYVKPSDVQPQKTNNNSNVDNN